MRFSVREWGTESSVRFHAERQLIAEKGLEHESAFLERLRQANHEVVHIDETLPPDQQFDQTLAASYNSTPFGGNGRGDGPTQAVRELAGA